MTEDEFFKDLSKFAGEFSLEDGHYLRRRIQYQDYCPITAVCMERTGLFFLSDDFDKAAEKIGLNVHKALQLVRAADNSVLIDPNPEEVKALRCRMLNVLKLEGGV